MQGRLQTQIFDGAFQSRPGLSLFAQSQIFDGASLRAFTTQLVKLALLLRQVDLGPLWHLEDLQAYLLHLQLGVPLSGVPSGIGADVGATPPRPV